MGSRGGQRDLVSRCWERAREHCKMLTGVDVTGVPRIKPTDGMTAWKQDGIRRESVLSCLLVSSGCSSSGQGLTHVKGRILTLGILQEWVMESSGSFASLKES